MSTRFTIEHLAGWTTIYLSTDSLKAILFEGVQVRVSSDYGKNDKVVSVIESSVLI